MGWATANGGLLDYLRGRATRTFRVPISFRSCQQRTEAYPKTTAAKKITAVVMLVLLEVGEEVTQLKALSGERCERGAARRFGLPQVGYLRPCRQSSKNQPMTTPNAPEMTAMSCVIGVSFLQG